MFLEELILGAEQRTPMAWLGCHPSMFHGTNRGLLEEIGVNCDKICDNPIIIKSGHKKTLNPNYVFQTKIFRNFK